MTTMPFFDVFDAILALAANEGRAVRVVEMRRAFERRTGSYGPEDPWFEARSRAFWDDALTTQDFASEVLGELPEAAKPWARSLARAHRGLFLAERGHGRHLLRDVWSGAEFLVDELDLASRDALLAPSGPFDARLACLWSPAGASPSGGSPAGASPSGGSPAGASPSGGSPAGADPARVALLPGAVFHPEDAAPALMKVLSTARTGGLSTGETLDALLRMELSLRTLTRVKPGYAYRPEALAPPR